MPASLTVGVLLVVGAVIAAKAGAWGLFQRKVIKRTDGFMARRAGVLFGAAGLLAALAAWLLIARPF